MMTEIRLVLMNSGVNHVSSCFDDIRDTQFRVKSFVHSQCYRIKPISVSFSHRCLKNSSRSMSLHSWNPASYHVSISRVSQTHSSFFGRKGEDDPRELDVLVSSVAKQSIVHSSDVGGSDCSANLKNTWKYIEDTYPYRIKTIICDPYLINAIIRVGEMAFNIRRVGVGGLTTLSYVGLCVSLCMALAVVLLNAFDRLKKRDVIAQLRDDCFIGAQLRDVVPAHFTFSIKSFSLLSKNSIEKYESNAFEAQGYKWNLSIYPNGNKNENGENHISLYLGIADTNSLPPACEINASFRFFVFDQIRDKYLILGDTGGITRRFHQMKTVWGSPKLLSLTTFQDASNGYLVNDTCVFGVEILVCDNKGCGEILSMIENPVTESVIWKIKNFSKLQDEMQYSDVFSAGGHKWELFAYPKGTLVGKNNSLSLFLRLVDSENCCTKVYASFRLRVINRIADNHKTMEGKRSFTGDSKGWGWPKFIHLNELNSNKEGFLVMGACSVEATITVLGVVKELPLKPKDIYTRNPEVNRKLQKLP